MTATHGSKGQLLQTSKPSLTITDLVLTDSGDHKTFKTGVSDQAKRYWDRTASWTIQAEYNEVQTVTVTGSPAGGNFTLTFGAQTTSNIAYNASASAVQSALRALSSINGANVVVTGANGGPWTVEFVSSLGFASQSLITKDASGLTGGTSPNIAIARTQGGASWTTQAATTYVLQCVGGKVIFKAAFLGTSVGCRIHSGKYLPYSAVANITKYGWDISRDVHEDTSLTTGGSPTRERTYQGGLNNATFKVTGWNTDNTYADGVLTDDDAIIASIVLDITQGTPTRLECLGYLNKDSIETPIDDLIGEDLDFQSDGGFYINS